MKKRITMILAVAMMLSVFAISASAAQRTEVIRCELNKGAKVSTGASLKTDASYTPLFFGAKEASATGWTEDGNEYVYFRGRSMSGVKATELAHENYYGREVVKTLKYTGIYGVTGNSYKMAIEYDINNVYQYANLLVRWNS